MNHPCVNGCSGWFKVPAAEHGTVIEPGPADPGTLGNVARANLEHRTEWFQAVPSPHDHRAEPPI